MTKEIISYSRLAEWTTCRYRWKLRYIDKIAARMDARPPTLGDAIHRGMAAVMLEKDHALAIDEWGEEYLRENIIPVGGAEDVITAGARELNFQIEELIDEVTSTAKGIVERTSKVFGPNQWEPVEINGVPAVEINLQSPIRGWGGYQGFLDLVAREKETGLIWVIDYKTRQQLQSETIEEVNLQMASYQYLALRHGVPTVGSLTFQILAKEPSIPKLNKDGTMSRQKIATDWTTYRQALVENGLDPADYAEMEEKLNVEFWRESRAYRSVLEIKNTWREVIQRMAWDMRRRTPHYWRKMNIFNCRQCWAREYCLEELRGGDTDFLVEFMYKRTDEGNDKEEEESNVPIASNE